MLIFTSLQFFRALKDIKIPKYHIYVLQHSISVY